ncbi:superoxide dismutase family protein [Tateyamaria omphalii]|uniref:superoxide dismutase family protein n=1 Tax=Tateyamaria omphalii TaxID=299262 RepID=UPI001C991C54|nr:superoxide dismutase family protein [Tateyamaria omphalii]MBY5932114.1 superoxide dismutase family protein [Tateyamaria omphalii]
MTKTMRTVFTSTILALGCTAALAGGHSTTATAELKNLEGAVIGMANLQQSPHGVLVHIKVSDLPPGKKGVHFHAKAHCAADTGFKSSHGHHGEGEGEHGLLNPAGPGKGDLGNIFVGTDGVGEMQFFKDGASIDGGDLPLLDEDGTAIVIHANADDQITQPIGGAGPRIVCGVLEAG